MANKIKINLNDIADFLFAFLLIYFMRSMWPSIPTLSILDKLMKLAFIAVICLKLVVTHLKKRRVNYLIILGAIAFYLMLYVAFRPINAGPYVKMLIFAIGAMVYQACENDKHSTFKFYVDLIFYISVVSLFLWFFGSLLGIIHPSGTVLSTWTGSEQKLLVNNYFYIHFEPQKAKIMFLGQITRNSSLFVEAPMFSFHLCTALLYELFAVPKSNYKRVTVIMLAIITTIAITGYIIAAIAITSKYIITGKKKGISKVLKVMALPVIVFALFIIINNLLTLKMNSFSGSVRLDDFSAGFKAWMVSPVFGNGYNNMKSIQQYMSSFRLNNMGFSNSPMLVLAYGGLYMAIPYMLAIYFSLKNCLENRQMICFVFLFLMMLIVTIVPFQPLVTYVFSWFITNDSNTKRDLVRLNRKYSMADLPVRK